MSRLNNKMWPYQYRNSYHKDKTVFRPSYIHNKIQYVERRSFILIQGQAVMGYCGHLPSWCRFSFQLQDKPWKCTGNLPRKGHGDLRWKPQLNTRDCSWYITSSNRQLVNTVCAMMIYLMWLCPPDLIHWGQDKWSLFYRRLFEIDIPQWKMFYLFSKDGSV